MNALLALLIVFVLQGVGFAQSEPYRPQVHFSPREHWTNDPNGLVYFEGEYHLFYQYNPQGDVWGHMSWGHAVSKDLLHWQELPVALPEHGGEMIFTGSVVVDERNSSGLCAGGTPCMVAVYTGHHIIGGDSKRYTQDQNLAVSQDRGRTWSFYKGNPVLDLHMKEFRDPSVTWNEPRKAWLMAVALPDDHVVAMYSSPDLKKWEKISSFGPAGDVAGQWECPDLLKVPVEGSAESVWALKVGLNPGGLQGGSGEQYFIGTFDGTSFKRLPSQQENGWTDWGKDSYCAISYNHLPAGEKPVLLGWMSNWEYAAEVPTKPWRGQMTLPRRLSARLVEGKYVLVQQPVVEALHGAELKDASAAVATPVEYRVSLQPDKAGSAGVRVRYDATHWVDVGFDVKRGVMFVDRSHSSVPVAKGFAVRTEAKMLRSLPLDLDVIVDASSVEVFAQQGAIAMTNLVYPPSGQVALEPLGAEVKMRARGWTLRK
ncbi:glycoside hydrolase family 32 protein [Granulicella cerasi]|uniref:Glycoside hydrolase family 32 protein n=1 Tax=Granulicella cerasi TaxID=741063 RepID=A0ABW1Z5U6_9BACT|nr:glycoside hydrolase family 32 protein [Granulicella cerasi]